MTTLTSRPATHAEITAWAASGVMKKQVAARLAREIALLPPHTRVESSMKIAAKNGVSNTVAANARHLLLGANLIYKNGRHYYTGQPKETIGQPR